MKKNLSKDSLSRSKASQKRSLSSASKFSRKSSYCAGHPLRMNVRQQKKNTQKQLFSQKSTAQHHHHNFRAKYHQRSFSLLQPQIIIFILLGVILLTAGSVFLARLPIRQVICYADGQPCDQFWQNQLEAVFLDQPMFFNNLAQKVTTDPSFNRQLSGLITQKKFPRTIILNLQFAPKSYYLQVGEQMWLVNQLGFISPVAAKEVTPIAQTINCAMTTVSACSSSASSFSSSEVDLSQSSSSSSLEPNSSFLPILDLSTSPLGEELKQSTTLTPLGEELKQSATLTNFDHDFYLTLWQEVFDLAKNDNLVIVKMIFDAEENLIIYLADGQEIWLDPTDLETSWARLMYLRQYWSDYTQAKKIDARFHSPVATFDKNIMTGEKSQISATEAAENTQN